MEKSLKYKIIKSKPSPEIYNLLRKSAGWSELNIEVIKASLDKSIYCICAITDNNTIGTARVIGDAGINYYIQDLIVFPDYQKQGIGTALLKNIMDYIYNNAPDNSFIALMAAKGKENFYKKFNFIERPNDIFGPGMCIIHKK